MSVAITFRTGGSPASLKGKLVIADDWIRSKNSNIIKSIGNHSSIMSLSTQAKDDIIIIFS